MEEAERKVADAHAAATRANAEVERFKAVRGLRPPTPCIGRLTFVLQERAQLEDRIAQLGSRQDSLASQLAEAEQELTSTKDTLQSERDAKVLWVLLLLVAQPHFHSNAPGCCARLPRKETTRLPLLP